MDHLHLEKHDVRVAIHTIIKALRDKDRKEFLEWLTAELKREQENIGIVMHFLVDIMEKIHG